MPIIRSFFDDDHEITSEDRFAGYDRFDFFQEKQNFFAPFGSGLNFRIYAGHDLYAVMNTGVDGFFEKSERIFDLKMTYVSDAQNCQYCEMQVRPHGRGQLLLQSLNTSSKLLMNVRGLEMPEVLVGREVVLAGVRSKSILAVHAPVWKDSERDIGVISKIYIREEVDCPIRDLLIAALGGPIVDRTLWRGISTSP